MRIPRRTNISSRVSRNAKSRIRSREFPETSKPSLWVTAFKLFAAIGAIGGLVLHLVGYVSQSSYLREWGIDSGLFPQDVDDAIILGYLAIVDRTFLIFSAIDYSLILNGLGIGLFVALYIYSAIHIFKPNSHASFSQRFKKIPKWLAELGEITSLTFIALAGIPAALALAALIMFIPVILADGFGKVLVERNIQSFSLGCNHASQTYACVELCSAKKSLAKGFVIDSSESHIAIYDVKLKRALAFERTGTNLIAEPPRTYSADETAKIPSITCNNFSPN